jgi:deoxyribonuclease-4
MSIAGGCHNALLEAQAHGCDCVQLFTKNANQWNARDIAAEEIRLFRRTRRETGIRCTVAHDSYLINLASPDDALQRKSIEAFIGEMNRAEQLRLNYLVMHPGAHVGSGDDAGLARVAAALDEVHTRCAKYRVRILVETTAGQGSTLGHRFEHLARIRSLVAAPERIGFCFDTCHVFAAGYSLSPEPEYRATMREFHRLVGLRHIKVFHVNDSVRESGSRVDRHEQLGKGQIGVEAFHLLVNDPRFARRPMILETPKEDADGNDMDAVNLGLLRDLVRAS